MTKPTIQTNETESWQMRQYQAGDEKDLVNLFSQVFERGITETQWRWKLKGLESSIENVWLASSNRKPIFQYAGIPNRYKLPTGLHTSMVSVDTMTAREFRRKGLLTTIGRKVYDYWKDAGIPFVIGLPNEKWGSRTEALGWEPLFRLEWLILPLNPSKIIARKIRFPIESLLSPIGSLWLKFQLNRTPEDPQLKLRQADRADETFDQLWEYCSRRLKYSMIRDSKWVNWRFFDSPIFDYQLISATRKDEMTGYIVFRIAEDSGHRVGFIAEIFTDSSDKRTFQTLLNKAIQNINRLGIESIVTLAVPGTWYHRALKNAGFFPRKKSFSVEYVPLNKGLINQEIYDSNNWFMSGADFDVI